MANISGCNAVSRQQNTGRRWILPSGACSLIILVQILDFQPFAV